MKIKELIKKLLVSIKRWKNKEECIVLSDEDVKKRYENSSMYYYYKKSIKGLENYINTHERKMPTIKQWNKMAKENDLLSAESMKYIMHIEFPQ